MSQPPVDLRSDTVTRPTPAMRRAMAEAEVGDDVFGEDPTVRRLEERAAELVGTAAALFVPTGTMGNQVALHVHGRPGTEVVLEAGSHIMNYELGAMAVVSGLLPRPVPTADGLLTPDAVVAALRPDDGLHAPTSLLCLENTHNMAGGRVLPTDRFRALVAAARSHGIPVHLDGARLFHAAAALGVPAPELTEGCGSVLVCLSKGLGAPVGSVVGGTEEFVRSARRVRKLLGGGMRQAGVLAAAGLVALEKMRERLPEDHVAAKRLAEGLAAVPGLEPVAPPETNILILRVSPEWSRRAPPADGPAAAFVRHLADGGVRALAVGPERVRMVTHFDLPEDAVERTLRAAKAP